jgi:hypothetical protein
MDPMRFGTQTRSKSASIDGNEQLALAGLALMQPPFRGLFGLAFNFSEFYIIGSRKCEFPRGNVLFRLNSDFRLSNNVEPNADF